MAVKTKISFALAAVSVLPACGTTNVTELEKYAEFPHYNVQSVPWDQVFAEEQDYYREIRHRPDGKPVRGLALSGGGQRSASVSLGFLAALDQQGMLDDMDVISSVSGGGYAAYWWYTKKYWAEKLGEHKAVFKPDEKDPVPLAYRRYVMPSAPKDYCNTPMARQAPYECRGSLPGGPSEDYKQWRFFLHSANHGFLMSWSQEYPYAQVGELAGKGLVLLPTIPVHWVANGLFDMKVNLNPLSSFYQNGIERGYGLYPVCEEGNCKKLESYANAGTFRLTADDPQHDSLLASMRKQNLPFWIINTTAAYSQSGAPKMLRNSPASGFSQALGNTAYEMSPMFRGSPRFGYCNDRVAGCAPGKMPPLSDMVAISGAAIDSLGAAQNSLIDVFNVALGRYVSNPLVDDSVRRVHRMLPVPFAWLHHNSHDETAPFIYLSDGGHSDNLGIYALIRRGVKDIVVLDNEAEDSPDKLALFQALQNDRCRLMQERKLLIDFADDKAPLYGKAACQSFSRKDLKFNYLAQPNPVFQGRICQVDNDQVVSCDQAVPGTETLKLTYVKLAVDAKKLQNKLLDETSCRGKYFDRGGDYSCQTAAYANSGNLDDRFPHDPTKDISYKATQYAGYYSLGFDLGSQLKSH